MIKIQVEHFENCKEDFPPLWQQHYKEIALDQDVIELDPNTEAYQFLSDNNSLVIFTVRDDGRLVGYAFFILQHSLHYKRVLTAINDLFYILPEYRGKFLGLKLLRAVEQVFKKHGVNQIQMRTKTYASFDKILERAGYRETEVVYRKNIAPL